MSSCTVSLASDKPGITRTGTLRTEKNNDQGRSGDPEAREAGLLEGINAAQVSWRSVIVFLVTLGLGGEIERREIECQASPLSITPPLIIYVFVVHSSRL